MIFYGIVYALLENDMRRILAYSIVNQVGFMVCGIGIGTEMALNGAAAHAFTHIIYKALLFMSAGAVLPTGKRKCSELGGLFQQHAADRRLRHHRRAGDLVLPADLGLHLQVDDLAGRRRRAHDLRLASCWPRPRPACSCTPASSSRGSCSSRRTPACGRRPAVEHAAGDGAVLGMCIGLGVFPGRSTRCCPTRSTTSPTPAAHVVTQLQLLLFSGLAFFVLLPMMKRT
jgi:multicomponent Na+:H+ antiporter subunit D